jgi:hypothetical protein
LHRLAEDLGNGSAYCRVECLVQPFLEMAIGNTDRQPVGIPAEFGVSFKPEFIAWLPDASSNRLPERRHDVALTDDQGIPRAQSILQGPQVMTS